ncbi:YCII-related protein [Solidesulfovibrio fructosivorans JJ]]|uniref:YCII-related protein n=1 Tax=Solidesulfovibrio fructosivorans JJ] TaxID=596151 RepID=E1JW73_SOLFR|nr:YciI family protein [Solidesulfovibrio fructosivorans]EFL51433.1 YCII-related protein [Solidesulfovibrio fructosivorans JJ]]
MFVVLLTYEKGLDVIDALLAEHIRFLEAQYAAGVFLLSGRREPRTGGVILARCENREALLAILARDPFWREGAARYEVVEFVPSMAGAGLDALLHF